MLVRNRMTPDPVIVSLQALFATVQEYMTVGHFRRLSVTHSVNEVLAVAEAWALPQLAALLGPGVNNESRR